LINGHALFNRFKEGESPGLSTGGFDIAITWLNGTMYQLMEKFCL